MFIKYSHQKLDMYNLNNNLKAVKRNKYLFEDMMLVIRRNEGVVIIKAFFFFHYLLFKVLALQIHASLAHAPKMALHTRVRAITTTLGPSVKHVSSS